MDDERTSTGSTASRRGFLRLGAAGVAAAGGAAAASGTAAARDEDAQHAAATAPADADSNWDAFASRAGAAAESQEEGGNGESDHGGAGGHEKGQLVMTPGILAMGASLILGVLSPIAFALFLAVKGDGSDDAGTVGRADTDLTRIDSGQQD